MGDEILLGKVESIAGGTSGSIGGREVGKASEIRYEVTMPFGNTMQTIEGIGCLEPEGDVDVFAFNEGQAVQVQVQGGGDRRGKAKIIITAPAHERASEACP